MPSPSLARPLFPQQRLRAWPAALLAAALPLVATSAPLPLADRPPAPGKDTHHALCHANYCVLVDGTGNRLGAYQTKAISTFTNGLAVFDDYDGVGKGIIDATGKVVVHGQFYSLKVHGNGLIQARASEYGGDLSYYDRTGKRVRHFEAGGTGRRHHARSWAGAPTVEQCNNDVCTTSVLGADGRTLAEFASLKELDGHDFAAASRDGRTFGLIDTQLAWKGRGDYADIRAAGKVLLAERDGGRTVLDAQGRELLPLADYQEMGRLDTGMYIATLPNSQTCLYFTAKGEALSPKRDDCVQGGGAALGYYIFANQQGSYVATLEGEAMSPMMGPVLMPLNRRAVLQVDHEWRAGTATPQGKPLLPCSYKGLKAFVENGTTTVLRDDLLVAHVEEGVGLLDLRGDWRIAPRYEEIVPLSTTLVAARADDEQWQILDITGTAIDAASSTLPARVPLPDGSSGFVVQSGEFHGLLGEDGRWRVPPRYAEVASVGGAVLVYRQAPAAGEATARFYDLASHSEQPEPLLVSASERADGLIEGIGVDGLMHLLTAEGRILASLPSERPTSATGPYAPPLTCSSLRAPVTPVPSPNPPHLPVNQRAQQVKREFQAELRTARRIVILIAMTFILPGTVAGLYLLLTAAKPVRAPELVALAAPGVLLALIGLPFAIPHLLRLRAAERRRPARSMTRCAAHPQRRVDNRLEATGLEAVAATGTRDILLLTAEGSRQVELDVPRWAQDARIDLYVPVVTGMPAMATLVDEHWLAALRYPEIPEVEVQEGPMTDADWAELRGSAEAAVRGICLIFGASLVVLVAVLLLLGLPLHQLPWMLGIVGGSMVGLGLLALLSNPQLRALRWRRSPNLCKRSYRGIATEVLLTSRRMASHRRSETHVRAWVRFGGGNHRQGDQWHWVGNWTDGNGAEADLLLDCVTVGEPMTVTYLYKNGRRKIRLQPQ